MKKLLLAVVLIVVFVMGGAYKNEISNFLLPVSWQSRGAMAVPWILGVIVLTLWLVAIGGLYEDVPEKRPGWPDDDDAFRSALPKRPSGPPEESRTSIAEPAGSTVGEESGGPSPPVSTA